MISLQILSGKQAGTVTEARRFPFQVGRDDGNDLRLEDDGVWGRHFQITSDPEDGFAVNVHAGAAVMINQLPVESTRLRNGDVITVGGAKIGFSIGATRQRGLKLREGVVWGLVIGVTLTQLVIIFWLLRQS